MDTPLLRTKLFIPATRAQLVERPHLLARLSNSHQQKLLLVTAPAGFGKTTLISTWLRQSGNTAAWVSLDENDNAPLVFLNYIIEAVQQVTGDACESVVPLMQAVEQPPLQRFSRIWSMIWQACRTGWFWCWMIMM